MKFFFATYPEETPPVEMMSAYRHIESPLCLTVDGIGMTYSLSRNKQDINAFTAHNIPPN